MEREPDTAGRRLMAILHADVAGYTSLMEADETGTYDALRRCLGIASRNVVAHGGRLVSTAGDAFLAEFPTVGEALAAATDFQGEMQGEASALPDGRRLAFRIGINLGEVIVDGDDIFGEGVNVAARIQALAPPGGIAVSEAVHALARARTELGFRDLGRQRLKNVAEPVHAWLVDGRAAAASPRPRRRRTALALATGLALAAGLAVLWTATPLSDRLVNALSPQRATGPEAPRDGRPTVAVLPFRPANAEADGGWFSAGVTEDIIHQLGRFSGLLVLSWNAVAEYRDASPAPAALAPDLGVRYVVGGTIRREGDRLRVSVELSDTATGVLLWSQRYEEPAGDLFELQDRITRAITGALAVQLTEAERERTRDRPTGDLGAYELVLQGRAMLHQPERDSNLDAREKFRRALEIDPGYAEAHAGLAASYAADAWWGWTDVPGEAIQNAEDHARRAIAEDPGHAGAHALLAQALWLQGNARAALDEADRALALNPNNAFANGMHGMLLLLTGRPEEAVMPLELGLRLDPKLDTIFVSDLAAGYYLLGRFVDAVATIEAVLPQIREDPAPYAVLAAALARLGRLDEARRAAAATRRLYPFFHAATFARNMAGADGAAQLVEGLRLAGLE